MPTNTKRSVQDGKKRAKQTPEADGAIRKTAAKKAPPVSNVSDSGEAAYARLAPLLARLPRERIVQPRSDVRAAASFVLSDTAQRIADPQLRARFLSLPRAEFDHDSLDRVVPAARAVLWAQAQQAGEAAEQSGVRLDPALFAEATELRKAMLEVCEYHFRTDLRLGQQLADIRSGHGYLDLAEDLHRLAALYVAEAKTLRLDQRFYQAADAQAAQDLSQRIFSELHTHTPKDARERVWRAWALLLQTYEEVAHAGRFLLRDGGDAAFPSLHVASRSTGRRRTAPAPMPGPAPDAG